MRRDIEIDDTIDDPIAAIAWLVATLAALLLCGWVAHEVARLVGWVR